MVARMGRIQTLTVIYVLRLACAWDFLSLPSDTRRAALRPCAILPAEVRILRLLQPCRHKRARQWSGYVDSVLEEARRWTC